MFCNLSPALKIQCSKLTVHTAPDAHISEAGRTFLDVCTRCAHIFSLNFHCNILEECTGKFPGAPRGAQIKTLISNTEIICLDYLYMEYIYSKCSVLSVGYLPIFLLSQVVQYLYPHVKKILICTHNPACITDNILLLSHTICCLLSAQKI